RAPQAATVEDEPGVADTVVAGSPGHHRLRVRHLRHSVRVHEAHRFDAAQARGEQCLEVGDLAVGRHHDVLVLETVTWTDFDDLDPGRVHVTGVSPGINVCNLLPSPSSVLQSCW